MIRKMQPEDISKIMTIWIKGNFKCNYFIEKDYWLLEFNKMKNDIINKYQTFVYVKENQIQGFISIYKNEIKAIYVKEDKKRQNIGRKLINFCRKKYNNLFIKIYEKNISAILFFNALSFKNEKININKK